MSRPSTPPSKALTDPTPRMSSADFNHWAARQPLAYELVDGVPVRHAKERQSPFRVAVVNALAEVVFEQPDVATAWLSTACSEFGGLSPADVAAESEDGSQFVLRSLLQWHRRASSTCNG
jgi:hypothetical protein